MVLGLTTFFLGPLAAHLIARVIIYAGLVFGANGWSYVDSGLGTLTLLADAPLLCGYFRVALGLFHFLTGLGLVVLFKSPALFDGRVFVVSGAFCVNGLTRSLLYLTMAVLGYFHIVFGPIRFVLGLGRLVSGALAVLVIYTRTLPLYFARLRPRLLRVGARLLQAPCGGRLPSLTLAGASLRPHRPVATLSVRAPQLVFLRATLARLLVLTVFIESGVVWNCSQARPA